MAFFQIAGGVALILFASRFLRKGLDRLFGSRLVVWMGRMTRWRITAFGAGVVAGAAAPSSTAQTLITLQLMNSGQVKFERMLAVLLGANVGITVMAQLLSFHVQQWAGLLIVLGVVGFLFLQREIFRGIGQSLLALGFLFLSMQMIGAGARSMDSTQEAAAWMGLLAGHPLVTFLLAAGLTVAVQSSTASIGFAIGLASAGFFEAGLLVPWVVGTNAGIAVTTIAAGWSTLDGRRLGLANLITRLSIATPCVFLPGISELLHPWLQGSPARDLAMLHTGFNLLAAAIFLPLLTPFSKLVSWMVLPQPPTTGGLPRSESHLDPQALESPALALANASRETLRMSDTVRAMLEHFWSGYSTRDLALVLRVQVEDDRVDHLYRALKDYLTRISDGVGPEEANWQFALLTFSNELESIGDIIDKNLADILRKQTTEAVWLPQEEYNLLEELHRRLIARFRIAEALMTSRSASGAREFLEGKETLNRWCREAERAHYSRLRGGDPRTIGASAYFLDLLDNFRRINSHLSAVAYAFRTITPRRRTRPSPSTLAPDSQTEPV